MLKRWCGNIYSTSERNYQTFYKIQEKSSFGRHVGEDMYALQHGVQYKSFFVEKSKCRKRIKCLPKLRFLSNFGLKIIFTGSVNFWHMQNSNSLFKGCIGYVTP